MEQCIITVKELTFETGIFDEIVNCTYVLLCCGPTPEREKSVYTNIDIFKPTSIVKLIYNSGYKKCTLTTSSMDDMASAQIYIFNDALKNNYKRILFLENREVELMTKYPLNFMYKFMYIYLQIAIINYTSSSSSSSSLLHDFN